MKVDSAFRTMCKKATTNVPSPTPDHLEMKQNEAYSIISGQDKSIEKEAKEFAMYETVDCIKIKQGNIMKTFAQTRLMTHT